MAKLRQLQSLFPDSINGPLPPLPGAYLLAITLNHSLAGSAGGNLYTFEPGTYIYAGSANGPGGIAARVARHQRATKKAHWHVDWLTKAAGRVIALGFPGGNECALVQELLISGYEIPVPGFGSSDCRSCPAHLLRLNKAGDSPRSAA